MKRLLVGVLLPFATIIAVGPSAALPPIFDPPAYVTDTDADGVVDALDPCPLATGVFDRPSRIAQCYLDMSWLPAEIQDPQTPGHGSWWSNAGCIPVMAFPVNDVAIDRVHERGVVIVGTDAQHQQAVFGAAIAGDPWPADEPARCLVSIGYGLTAPIKIDGPAVATFYVSWNPPISIDEYYQPKDGLGLIRSDGIQEVNTRVSGEFVLQRLRFSRGGLWGRDLGAGSGSVCNPTGGDPGFCDPARPGGTTRCHLAFDCLALDVLATPADWRLIPSPLDVALMLHKNLVRDALDVGGPLALAYYDAIEGVPRGLRADDRWYAQFVNPVRESYDLPSTATIWSPREEVPVCRSSGQPLCYPEPVDPWIIVPAAIGRLAQHRWIDGVRGRSYRPTGAAEYTLSASPAGTLLALQRFAIDDPDEGGLVVRTVETAWPAWPPVAATSEESPRYGTRWTSNGGPRECWQSGLWEDALARPIHQQLAYPVSSGAGKDAIAAAWCPSALRAWRDEQPAASTQSEAEAVCKPAIDVVDGLEDYLVSAIADPTSLACVGYSTVVSVLKDVTCCVACLASHIPFDGCVLGSPSCCDPVTVTRDQSDAAVSCIIQKFIDKFTREFGNDIHWKDLRTADHRLVPLVGMMRSEGAATARVVSVMTTNDQFLVHSHQGTDWNWRMPPDDPTDLMTGLSLPAIDPAYRLIATRDAKFLGIEPEMEFQVAMGRWTDNGHELNTYDLHGKAARFYAIDDQKPLGEIWPDQFCSLFGIDRDPNKESNPSWPVPACGGSDVWRTHFGRGLFAPISSETIAGKMDLNAAWPGAPSGGTVGLDLQDWGDRPHRLGFLGQPIADCGHAPYRVEIHPPHVITMDLADIHDPGASIFEVATAGVLVGAFGWANIESESRLEFDLWPRSRPHATSVLVVRGNASLGHLPGTYGPGDLGFTIDASAPQHDPAKPLPTMTCSLQPASYPNHVHCTYDDPSAGTHTPVLTDPSLYGNPRQTPYFATSRFDVRMFLGWL